MKATPFLWCTGIENSYPTIAGGVRIDQMRKCGHYERWQEDFSLVRELGLDALRWGPAYYRTHTGPDQYDFSSADEPMRMLRSRGIEVILDLCHFGVPDWLGDFQNPAFPIHFAAYARTVAVRYPWVRFFTPVNEIFICARFSALYGWWNERLADEGAFVRALKNLCLAHELAVEAILDVRPDAVFVQAESIERFHPKHADEPAGAAFMNSMRFLSLDLTLGRAPEPSMMELLRRHGVTTHELAFFRERRAVGQRWLGTDYYPTCEHEVGPDLVARGPHERPAGFAAVAREYAHRYGIPLFHCETNHPADTAPRWLDEQWEQICLLLREGVDVRGFTWFSLTDQIDWQHALREERDDLHPVGLFDLDRTIRPVGERFRELVQQARADGSRHGPRRLAS